METLNNLNQVFQGRVLLRFLISALSHYRELVITPYTAKPSGRNRIVVSNGRMTG